MKFDADGNDLTGFIVSEISGEPSTTHFRCPVCGYFDYELSQYKLTNDRYFKHGNTCCKEQQASEQFVLTMQNILLKRQIYQEQKSADTERQNNNGIIWLGVVPVLFGFIFPPLFMFGIGTLLLALFIHVGKYRR